METIIVICLITAAFYLVTGLVFAVFFIAKGIMEVDGDAKGTGPGFRIIILPGVILLWPLLLKKWLLVRRR